jgi:hypothetical protein
MKAAVLANLRGRPASRSESEAWIVTNPNVVEVKTA